MPMALPGMRASAARKIGIDIDIQPSPVILASQLLAISTELKNFKEPLTDCVKKIMMPSIRKNFDVEGRPSWAPLSSATLSRRAYEGSGTTSGILSRTAALRRRAAAFKAWTINREQAYIASLGAGSGGVPWAKLHQEGYEGGGDVIGRIIRNGVPQRSGIKAKPGDEIVEAYVGDIPARPFLVIQPEDAEHMEQEFDKWIAKAFAKHGWGAV